MGLDELAGYGVSTIFEAAGRRGVVDASLIRVIPGSRVAGIARTVRCAQDDNLTVHAVMETIQPGEVLVVTMPEPRPVSLVGDLLALQAKAHGAVGILVDGAVRDIEELCELNIPTWSRYVRAIAANRDQLGEINVPVFMGGVRIEPGDTIVMDADGAVVVPAARVPDVLAAARARTEREVTIRPRLEAGELTYDLNGLRPAAAR